MRLLVGPFRVVVKIRSPTVPKELREEENRRRDRGPVSGSTRASVFGFGIYFAFCGRSRKEFLAFQSLKLRMLIY